MRKNGCKWFDKLTILRFCSGFTLVELSITIVIFLILTLVVGVLLVSGNRAWLQTLASANKQGKQDAMAASIAFGSMGRKSNRLSYTVYEVSGNNLTPAKPKTKNPTEVVWGDAVNLDTGMFHWTRRTVMGLWMLKSWQRLMHFFTWTVTN